MEAKLKTLKVADLKEICTRANVPTTTRLTKADLVTKILASQPAINAYNAKYQQNGSAAPSSKPAEPSAHDDLLAPPEEVDWTLEDPSPSVPVPTAASSPPKANTTTNPAPPTKPQSKAVPPKATPDASETSKASAPAPAASVDDELEKRKARAARFGIALVEPSKPKTKSTSAPAPKAAKTTDDPEKLKTRAQRFGTGQGEQKEGAKVQAVGNKKRGAAVVEEVDPEEQERRRKRAERFGIPAVGAKA